MNEQRHLYEALTRWNYFPNQKSGVEEMPPCFSTRTFTPEIAEILAGLKIPSERHRLGYDHVEYSASRHNNVSRTLGLIHPSPYAKLTKIIHDNWQEISHITSNKNSMIKPTFHADGRIIVMNYESPEERLSRSINDGFAKRFRVHTDISRCFQSIYTHAIPWAVIGFDQSKKNLSLPPNRKKHWSEILDAKQRKTKRCETQGVPIGPATSSIVSELILGKVDTELRDQEFSFYRYIDDYVCFCKTYEEAERFLNILDTELRKYKLSLNSHKTSIAELPEPTNDSWVAQLTAALPTAFIDNRFSQRKFTLSEIQQFLDFAVRLNKHTPDGSVLKFAVGSIIYKVDLQSVEKVFEYILGLSWHFPLLLPYLDVLMKAEYFEIEKYAERLNIIALENALHKRSDGIAWTLYFLTKHGLKPDLEVVSSVLASEDCIGMLSLYQTGEGLEEILRYANKLIAGEVYDRDRYWLLLYQLYLDEKIENPYAGDSTFELLRKYRVNFLDTSPTSLAQHYCFLTDNPFAEPDDVVPEFIPWFEEESERQKAIRN